MTQYTILLYRKRIRYIIEYLLLYRGKQTVITRKNENDLIKLIEDYRLSREMIPTEFLNKPAYNITAYDQKSYEAVGGKGLAKFKDYKGLGIKKKDQYFKIKNKKLKPASTV